MLKVLAGPDGLDPRQHAGREAQLYTELMKGGVNGLRIGIVIEGFGWDNSMPGVDAQVRKAVGASPNSVRASSKCRCRCTAWASRSGCPWQPRAQRSR